jgi:alpha-tubulin suppressor-like RCC1 family protein
MSPAPAASARGRLWLWLLPCLLALAPLAQAGTTVVAWGDNAAGQTRMPDGLSNVVALAAGSTHTVALRADGTAVAWGTTCDDFPGLPTNLSNLVAVSSGDGHSLLLNAEGRVTAWGCFKDGPAFVPAGLAEVLAIASGQFHGLALQGGGTVRAWGDNLYGQTNVPPELSNVVRVAAGDRHNLAVRADGTVAAWGANESGQTNVPPGLSNVVAVAAGSRHSLALTADSRVIAWGDNQAGQTNVPPSPWPVLAIAAAGDHGLALLGDGSAVAWGDATNGSLAVPAGLGPVVAVATGRRHSLALVGEALPAVGQAPLNRRVTAGGSALFQVTALSPSACVYEWRRNGEPLVEEARLRGVAAPQLMLTAVTAADAGDYSVVIRNASGSVTSAVAVLSVRPYDSPPEIIVQPVGTTNLAGTSVSFTVTAAGTGPFTYRWYRNGISLIDFMYTSGVRTPTLSLQNLATGLTGMVSVVVSNAYGGVTSSNATLLVLSDSAGRITQWGAAPRPYYPNDSVDKLNGIVAVDAGEDFGLALAEDGRMTSWGDSISAAMKQPGVSNIIAIAAGSRHALGLRADGTVVAWGDNTSGQTNVPVGLTNVVAVAAGSSYCLALRSDGTLAGWGNNYVNDLINLCSGMRHFVAVAGGASQILALRTDGTVAAWGDNRFGECNVPAGLTNVISVSAGTRHSLALRADGSVAAWGMNLYGECNVPPGLSNVVAIEAASNFSLAVRADGTVVTWGNPNTWLTMPTGLTNVVAVASRSVYCIALNGQTNVQAPPHLIGTRYHLGEVGEFLCYRIAAVNGARGFSASGLPPGLSVDTDTGWITGRPLQAGTFPVRISATNEFGTGQWKATLVVNIPTPEVLSQVAVSPPGTSFSHKVSITSRATPVSVEGLPAGWSFDFANGEISGTGSIPGDYPVTVVASNAFGLASGVVTVRISPVVAWGENSFNKTIVPPGLTNVVALSGGLNHNLALKADGTVVAWGDNYYGQSDVPSTLTNVVAVKACEDRSLALRADGIMLSWGNGVKTVPPGSEGLSNVTSQAWLVGPAGLSNIVVMAGGVLHSAVLLANSKVIAWGLNNVGQTTVPAGLNQVISLAAAGNQFTAFNLALRADGTVVPWGRTQGSLTTTTALLSNVVAVAAGADLDIGMAHAVALMKVGTVTAWGANYFGQTNVPPDLTNAVAISAGRNHSLALRADGTVTAWGSNGAGQTNIPAGLSGVLLVAAGQNHNLALVGSGPPVISQPPLSHVAWEGESTIFLVQAFGQDGLQYQWQLNGTNLVEDARTRGTQAPALLLDNVQLSDAAGYSVVVANSQGSVTSVVARLTVSYVPRLQYGRAGERLRLFWPASWGELVLETSPSLMEGAAWLPLTNGLGRSENWMETLAQPESSPIFYRLRKPSATP